MKFDAKTYKEFILELPEDRRSAIERLKNTISENLPEGFMETYSKGFIHFVIPLDKYPEGYLSNPSEPLPFISIASQKNYIALYHLGIYAFSNILNWFREEYPKYVKTKLDMGKSCIRFKNINEIPYELIGKLCKKITVEMWIEKYESARKEK
ncbi:MAG TPA: DUF1801 domain-containing protein [Acholeplasmataceae bacterium]|nr:DUF1801 domain-containing protein [Acholeplasmataceae bacterium]